MGCVDADFKSTRKLNKRKKKSNTENLHSSILGVRPWE